MSRYELTTRVETKNPETINKLIGGTGLLTMLSDSINRMSSNSYVYSDYTFSLLDETDFDKNDKIVQSIFDKLNTEERVLA